MRFINKLSIIILATFLFSSTTNAQTLSPFTFNNGGGYSNTLDWSIGESVSIAHFTSFGYSLNTGVLQPTTPITTAIEEYGPAVFGNQIIMGPNPTSKLLHIKASFNEVGAISFQMFNSKSNNVLSYDGGTIFSKYEKDLYLETLPAGVYYMKVYFKPSTGNAQGINIYHNYVRKLVRSNFKSIEEHRPEEIMSGISDITLEHTFAGDNSLSGTRHDKESVLRWFKRVNTVLPDLKFEMTDIQVKGGPANTLVIARWTATCHLLNGEPYENKGVHFITIKWGKAVKFDVYENTKVVSHGLDIQFEAGIKEAKAPKIVS